MFWFRPPVPSEWWEPIRREAPGFHPDRIGAARTGPVGDATARLMGQRAVVDFATAWIAAHRGPAAG